MTIAEFDHLPEEKKKELLHQCCGSDEWVNRMLTVFPVEDLVEFLDSADQKWNDCSREGKMQAFEHHPKIGDLNSLKEKFATTAQLAVEEQSGVNGANKNTLEQLVAGNDEYLNKFGFIFITCARGKSADKMLNELKERLANTRDEEIKHAAAEQLKITKLRLEKLFEINDSIETYEL